MASITIHNLSSKLDERLSAEARRSKKSKNQLVKDFLARSLGLAAEGSGYYADDYREFCGLWSAADRDAFILSQADNSLVDEGDWSS